MRKIVETRSLLIKDTSTIMHNPLSEYVGRGYIRMHMIVLVSLIVLLRRLLVSTIFRMVHPSSLFIQ